MGVPDNLLPRILWLAVGTFLPTSPIRAVVFDLGIIVSIRTAHEGQGDLPSTSLAEIIAKIEA